MTPLVIRNVRKNKIPAEWGKALPSNITFTIVIEPEEKNVWKESSKDHLLQKYDKEDSIYDEL